MGEDPHARFDRLAVGHVVGGLDPVDAAAFRSHLLSCRECRLRVAELRDIASDMAAAERDERASARLKTEVARREAPTREPPRVELAGWRSWPWRTVGLALVPVVLVGLLVWNLLLRDQRAQLSSVAERQQDVIRVVADGQLAQTGIEPGVDGVVYATDDRVALDLAGLEDEIGSSDLAVVWLLDADGAVVSREGTYTPAGLVDGRLVLTVPRRGADAVQVTVEETTVDAPTGLQLVDAQLPAG